MKLRNANAAAKVTGLDELAGTSNYFIGNDPAKWRRNVPTYAKVKYEGIYSGIDLVYYGNQRQLEYDFIVAPGADPRRIAFDVSGAKRIRRDGKGELIFNVGEGEIRWHKPVVYQEKDGARQGIAARYAITAANRVTFELAKYEASKPLYIDPLIYSTYLGGSYDSGYAIAVDGVGNAYVTGGAGADFPTTPGAFQTTCCGAFVTKFNPSGSALLYSTYLGGNTNGNARGFAITVDSTGNAYVAGEAHFTDFPVTPGAFQTVCGGTCEGNAFIAKLNSAGSALVYSTYLGGSGSGEYGYAIAIDGAGNSYVTGVTGSTDFPITPGAFQAGCGSGCRTAGSGFVTKMNPTGTALAYSSFLGGSAGSGGTGIVVDSSGNAYVSGWTDSIDFPVTPGAFQTTSAGGEDAFVTKVNPTGSALVYSTYLGGSGQDVGQAIALDGAGNAYVTGSTESTNFPVTPGAFRTTLAGVADVFVTKLNPTGSALVYSTYLGGSYNDWGNGIAVDSAGNAYVTGATGSTNFPTMNPMQPAFEGGVSNAFVTKFNPMGSGLVYSTYLGGNYVDWGYGIALDSAGNAYVTGSTTSTTFPTMNPMQPALDGDQNAFVAKITAAPSDVTLFPLHLNFAGQPIGITSSPQVSTLINAGSDTLTITSIRVMGANSGDFAQSNDCGTSVPPGTNCSITVTFTPPALGNRSAAVSVTSSDPFSPQQLSITGVSLLDSATKLTSSKNPSVLHKPVTFKATVSSPSGGTPTGSVSFLDGTTTLATKPIKAATATFTTSILPQGYHSITAFYGGDSNYGFSTSAPMSQHVIQATTTNTLSSSPNPSTYGEAVTFTAVVTSSIGPPPDGETVSFMKGKTLLGTGVLSGGSATFTISTLKFGTTSVTAVYGGDANLGGSTSKAVSQVVNKATTTTTLTSSLNPSKVGQSVTFTAKVSPQFSGTVTGTVTFYDGATVLKTAPLSGGAAKFTTSALASGTHSIAATYNGSTSFGGSSASLTQTVN